MRNTIPKVFLSLAFLASLAFASNTSNRAGANFVYEYGKMFEAELNSSRINLNAKILFQNPLSFDWNSTSIESDGGELVFLSASFPFSINTLTLKPSFLFGNGIWKRGDFEHFYGKPDLPNVLGFGMSFYQGPSAFCVHYILGKAKLLNNNESAELFNSDFYIYNAFYKYDVNNNLDLAVGFAGLNAEAGGALTAENQGYFLFPYAFYEANGYLDAKAIYALANLKIKTASAEYGLDFGALTALSGKIAGNMHYKYRKFYGTEEVFETLNPVQIKNSGIAFSILSIKTKKISFGKNHIQYGIKKPFAVSFGEVFPKNEENSSDFLKDIFLSGLTANVDIWF